MRAVVARSSGQSRRRGKNGGCRYDSSMNVKLANGSCGVSGTSESSVSLNVLLHAKRHLESILLNRPSLLSGTLCLVP